MGNHIGSLKKEEVEQLVSSSHFDAKELKSLFKDFKKDSPGGGVIGKTEFRDIMTQMGIADTFLHELLFNVFDKNKDNTINFQEFVCGLSVITRGTPEEKIEFAFSLYDLDGNGYITKKEMESILESMYRLVGPFVTCSGKRLDQQDMIDDFFEKMDDNGDGMISLEEYKRGTLKNPDIIQGLKIIQ
ncbi:calcium-binding protein [Heterostelium album PN500]|uniref:Calcium-binding protein n=1 Tax=Heterostelium pallidum (strain ATCC 26659 / Pp 5 / PN500) TaxID=670386 RepID=D3B5T3_HETP5|nr:calcium-binding protein [Heterostelium album PN500]EFA83231.1 calcium-binding protein [Heterostelium album PN500]|eukprot:XP_020435348.1 calcium-binding protein [Heterostelium album PN500]